MIYYSQTSLKKQIYSVLFTFFCFVDEVIISSWRKLKNMKNKVFFFLMLAISILLFLLRVTGMAAHIALSVVGIVALVAFAVMTKKEWTKPALEILLRVLFAVAVISGIVMMATSAAAVVAIVHKAAAAVFVVMLLVTYIPKLCKKA